MTLGQINKMSRVDLILAAQGYIKDPAINTSDLSTEELRKIVKLQCETRQNKWTEYLLYLRRWVDAHRDEEFYGMTPACFDEWEDNEFEEE